MMDKAVSRAERIRASQGSHEAEVSCTGEHCLHQCLIMCQKNPGHQNFIPTEDFSIDHLPTRYRDNDIVDYVRATSDLTCRLSVTGISEDRPDTWPDSDQAFPFSAYKGEKSMMTGTGLVSRVLKFTGKNKSPGTHTPNKVRGEVYILTACHVVHDDEEARHTKCQFFYDSHETDINNVLTLAGLKVVDGDIKGDWYELVYFTHDVKLLDRFYSMYRRWWDLHEKLCNKFVSLNYSRVWAPGVGSDANLGLDLCIVVSHPHGCTKQVTVGTWTNRQVVRKDSRGRSIIYNYNTPTCPGSSGAPVISLCEDSWAWPGRRYSHHPTHSQGRPGNDNNSGIGEEWFH